ncbi:MAG: T9SS C-terminal target domain-containing protein [Flavobacteriia bacterium]|nr:T9SS C-terminal target domain-containing protein [Flavobacteriia bacterium]
MKKSLPLLAFFSFFAFASFGQSCVPGANFVDSTYGVWPDTTQNFPPAAANVAYSTDLNFKVPATVTAELDASGQFVGSPIQSFTVTGVQGLPAGYNYACNIANCTYNGGANGCANIWGTTATTGTYPITIEVDATVLVSLFPGLPPAPVTQSVSFSGYKIIVGSAGLGISTVKGLNGTRLSLSNLSGQELFVKSIEGLSSTELNLNGFNAGIYFINVYGEQGVETIRIIKN